MAAYDGTVVGSFLDLPGGDCKYAPGHPKGYGEVVVIQHDDGPTKYYTLYGHMAPGSRVVNVGEAVEQGQQIGVMGSTGCSTGQHVHFEIGTKVANLDGLGLVVTPLSSLWNAPDPYADGTYADGTPETQGTLTGGSYNGLDRLLWATRYDGPAKGTDGASALAVSPDGSKLYVTGASSGLHGGSYQDDTNDYATVAYEATTGQQLWRVRYNGPANREDDAVAIRVSPDGSKVFVTGSSYGSSRDYDFDYATLAYNAATGKQLWAKRYNGPGNVEDDARALGISPDGSKVFVTGASYGGPSPSTNTDYATLAYDAASGKQLWATRYNGPSSFHDRANALAISQDGSKVFVTGSADVAYNARQDCATVAYDTTTGKEQWVARFAGWGTSESESSVEGDAVVASPDGSKVFVTGLGGALPASRYDYATLAYDATSGSQLWSKRWSGPGYGDDIPRALGVSPDGSKLFVTGGSWTTPSGWATVAYGTATGSKLWVKGWTGPPGTSGGSATALGVSPDGSKLFVAGAVGPPEYGTAAYAAATGTQLWTKLYHVQGLGTGGGATALGLSPDGSKLFVTGESVGSTGSSDYATVAYSTP